MLTEEKRNCFVDEWIEIKSSRTCKYYESLGYKKYRNKEGKLAFNIHPWDLKQTSHIKIRVKCYKCEKVRETCYRDFYKAKTALCNSCAVNQKCMKDLTGQRFGRLTTIQPTNKRTNDGCTIWLCKCECGNICEISSHSLLKGNTKSCGCLKIEKVSECMTNLHRNKGHFIKADHTEEEIQEHLQNINTRDNDFKWKNISKKLRKNGECLFCGSTENLVVHHKDGYWEFPEQRYDEDNLVVLCRSCHTKLHNVIKSEITEFEFNKYMEAI